MYVVITGGSRGIGAAAVRRFAARGDHVWFLYKTHHDDAARLAAETGAVALCADVADEAAVGAAFAGIPDVDVLICNAGIAHYGLIQDISPAVWDQLFFTNVKGIYHCVRAALPHFLRKQSGNLITVSSIWGEKGASCESTYAATKGAIIAMTKSLAKELAPSGVRANCIAPGVIRTPMVTDYFSDEALDALAEEIPLGHRLGRPEEIAEIMEFLATDRSRYITGEVFSVNGGFAN